MPVIYSIAFILMLASAWLGVEASDAYDAAAAARSTNVELEAELVQLESDRARLEQLEPTPLRFNAEALSTFYSRVLEAGEVVGVGVRVQSRDSDMGMTSLIFQDQGQGVGVCRVTLQAAIEGEDAIPVLAMFEEELAELPVTVRAVTAKRVSADIGLTMDVDIFGRMQ